MHSRYLYSKVLPGNLSYALFELAFWINHEKERDWGIVCPYYIDILLSIIPFVYKINIIIIRVNLKENKNTPQKKEARGKT